MTVTAFHPLRGKGKLLRTIERAKEFEGANLSPDGTILAVARGDQPYIHIDLLSLTDGPDREIALKGWTNIAGGDWSHDGKGLYVGSTSSQGATLLYVDLKGTAHVLWHRDAGVGTDLAALASPDGRYLALGGAVRNTNVWIVEGF
jgi:WD40 repeat protein